MKILLLLLALNSFAADRYTFVSGSVSSGSSVNSDSTAVPSGTSVFVDKIGFASQINSLTTGLVNNVPDTRSDVLQVQFGTSGNFQTVMLMALSGNTIEVQLGRTFTGDGSKFFRITRTNQSGSARTSAAWFVAYDVQ